MDTMLLNPGNWDLLLDAEGNIARATEPYANAQDVASAIRTFQGEVYYDQSKGMPYSQILGQIPAAQFVVAQIEQIALTVPDIVEAKATTTRGADRILSGTVQVINTAGQVSNVQFL